ncbi:MAG: glycoside hydrolase family 5 protein, partial [Verrucomicrobiae bacterium]|nr:glycoside hydrolase family 5 protein [Verrucomicrobiae bacterium]
VEGPAKLEQGYQGEKALSIENPPEQIQASRIVSIVLPVDVVRGRLVRVTAMVKAEGVTAKPKPWNGIKCMLVMEASDRKLWPQAEIPTGTFDWQRAAFTARVPANVTSVRLVLGLEAVAGKVWFDNIKVVAVRTPIDPKEAKVPSRFYKGHTLPRLRGAMVSPDIDEEGLRVLGREWNANLVRWQLVRHGRQGQSISLAEYNVWLEQALNKLDKSLPWCEEHGLYVVVDLHSPPGGKVTAGGYAGSDDRLFSDKACQARFVEIWRHIAQRYKHCKAIWGYDLANEPVEDFVEEGCDDWQALAERAAREIRNIDPDRAIIVEPASWGGPDGLRDLVPLPMSNVVYSVHMYVPHAFTHQGVYDRGPAVHYPGVIGGEYWDKSALERVLRPVIEFQQTYGVHIYIGEFSAIRWAPGDSAMQYLRDLIEIFEKHGWDWSYHAFREWHGWSVEHDSDRNNTRPVETPTDRQMLLRQWYSQNQKPPWWRK